MSKHVLKNKKEEEIQDWQEMFAQWAEEAPEGPLKRYYQAGMIAANTSLKDAPLLALDLETTGLDPHQDEIISLGLIPLSSKIIRCQGAKYWMAKPEHSLNAESVTIHEITHAELAGAPSLNAILDEILIALTNQVVVVHCVSIERQFLLEASMKAYGYPLYFPVLDTMDIERQATFKPWWQRFGRRPSLRLDACRQRYKLPRYKAHHALTDALSSAELLQAQISYHMDPEADISNYWM
ncbi:MAG: 3'-5' exonuclease [Marinomonas foliarum]|jgi:DNA polymerase III subunit epsilon|uniref:3'-5' exonuclease n=1 Tax=Marinomonas foliarum TaxID=491950 RepID=A0A369ACA8_9GAMM|nr:3'-5' exonuclease [Marinomonas foliarum]QRV25554.1 3'-5' exonuclease [Marinomonas foliarum]RCX06813.1 DNA polymerase-3 subunit epsilon [Marinomonas foliarum]